MKEEFWFNFFFPSLVDFFLVFYGFKRLQDGLERVLWCSYFLGE
jgi:hypothetical protein